MFGKLYIVVQKVKYFNENELRERKTDCSSWKIKQSSAIYDSRVATAIEGNNYSVKISSLLTQFNIRKQLWQ